MFTLRNVFAGRPVLLHPARDTEHFLCGAPVVPGRTFLFERGRDGWHTMHRGFPRSTHRSRDVRGVAEVVSAIDTGHDEVREWLQDVPDRHVDRGRWRRRQPDRLQPIRQREVLPKDRLAGDNRVPLPALILGGANDDHLANRLENLRHGGQPRCTHAIVIADENPVRGRLLRADRDEQP